MANTIDFKDKMLMNGVGMDIAAAIWGVRSAILGERSLASDWYKVQADVDAGLGPINYPVGTLLTASHETGIQTTIHGTGITTAAVDEDAFIAATGHAGAAVYEYVYDGNAWKHGETEVLLSELGITVTGTPVADDAIIVTELDEKLPFLVVDSREDYIDLLMAYGINSRPFDGIEAFYRVTADEGLPAGTYNVIMGVTWGDKGYVIKDDTWQFTLTRAVPKGGQLYGFTTPADTAPANWQVASYASGSDTIALETVTPTKGSAGTCLGTMQYAGDGNLNSFHRSGYGSNHWGESNVRQWLNSDKPAGEWYKPQTGWDRLSSTYASLPGFMRHLDPAFVGVLADTENVCAYNTVMNADGQKSGSYTVKDKFWLPSMTQLGYGNNNSVAEGDVWPLFRDMANIDKRVFDIANHSVARYRWMRSASPSYAHPVRYVNSSTGALSNYGAYSGYCVAPACRIIRRKIS